MVVRGVRLADSILRSVFVTGQRDVWVVGESDYSAGGSVPLILRWHGSTLDDINGDEWDISPSVNTQTGNVLRGVAAIPGSTKPITNVWAVGNYTQTNTSNTMVESIKSPAAPSSSTSNFVQTTYTQTNYNAGYEAGKNISVGVAILSFGRPVTITAGISPTYGARLFTSSPQYYSDTTAIATAVASYTDGFHAGYMASHRVCIIPGCYTVAVGITNGNRNNDDSDTVNAAHAIAWATMVNNIQHYTSNKGYSEISIAAAIDAEPNWNTRYSNTFQWIQSFVLHSPQLIYNFGSTDGYPCVNTSDRLPASLGCSAWTMSQFYNVSWYTGSSISGRPIPQIYKGLWARYWYLIKHWSIDTNPNAPSKQIFMNGETTHFRSCGVSTCTADLTPEQAWQSLWLELNADSLTQQDFYSTDFSDMRLAKLRHYDHLGCRK